MIINSVLIRVLPRQRSWLDFLWPALTSPLLAILIDHKHPLSPGPFFFISFFTCGKIKWKEKSSVIVRVELEIKETVYDFAVKRAFSLI